MRSSLPRASVHKRRWLKRLAIIFGCLVFLMAGAFYYFMRPMFSYNPSNVPQLVTANPVDINGVYMVSKFRSGAGHDYSDTYDGETCRSMKHYFNAGHNEVNGRPVRSLPSPGRPNINIYAPFDGKITAVDTENTPIGKQVHVRSAKYPSYSARLFHIDLVNGFKKGSSVKSGQQIGIIGPMDGTDVSIEAVKFPSSPILLSMFQVMTDQAFKPYQDLGYQRGDFVTSRAYRDAHPFKCGGGHNNEGFVHEAGYNPQVDYLYLKADPYQQNRGPGAPSVRIDPPLRN